MDPSPVTVGPPVGPFSAAWGEPMVNAPGLPPQGAMIWQAGQACGPGGQLQQPPLGAMFPALVPMPMPGIHPPWGMHRIDQEGHRTQDPPGHHGHNGWDGHGAHPAQRLDPASTLDGYSQRGRSRSPTPQPLEARPRSATPPPLGTRPRTPTPPRARSPLALSEQAIASKPSRDWRHHSSTHVPTPTKNRGRSPVPSQQRETRRSAEEAEVDEVLGKRGYTVARSRVFNPGLPAGALGKGTFGTVYKATSSGGREYAVKMVARVSQFQGLIQKEIEVMTLLSHPNIVGLVEAVVHPPRDWLFIIMEFVEGGDMLGALTRFPHTFDEALTRALMFHVACGLAFAHETGVLHRDIKPENILLRRDGFPKIADFGLARLVGRTEVCQTMAGTPGYLAPEIMDANVPYNFPADVFSLGLVFADMMNDGACCQWAINTRPPAERERLLKRWPPGVSPPRHSASLAQLHQKMLSQAPGERPTLYRFCLDLQQLASEDPMPHKLWTASTKMASQPPPTVALSADSAAEIAGRCGYAKGVAVRILTEGEWRKGVVEHISKEHCPGGAQVRLQGRGGRAGTAVFVCPWQFRDVLRPLAVKSPPSWDDESNCTMAVDAGPPKDWSVRAMKEAPIVRRTKCMFAACAVM